MDSSPRNSGISLCQALCLACSFKKCCLFLLGPLVTIFGLAALIIVFVLKPQKPTFSIQTVNIDSYKLDVLSEATLFVSSVVSLTLSAQNPNRVGIRYSHSRLHLLNEGLVIGMIRVPEFYQPARSSNVSVPTYLFFHCVNVSAILSAGVTKSDDSNRSGFAVRVVGDIEARLWVLHIKMPKIKVALDCDVGIDYRYLAFANEVNSLKALFKNHHLESNNIPANPQTFSNKCSVSIYI